jgi:tetratricopeptide (TPR) repeat protein
VSAETVHVAGVRSVRVINKYERRPAYAYDGTLTIPLKDAHYTITMHSIERGITGARDALVTAHLAGRGELEIEKVEEADGGKPIRGWFQDPYDPSYPGRALYSMSDDERLDALFPHHPLSKIRAFLTQVQNTLVIDQAVARDSVEVPNPREAEAAERPRYLLSCRTVATLYFEVKMFDQAEKVLADSIAKIEHTSGVNDLDHARTLFLLGLARDSQGKEADAEPVLSRAWSIFKANLGEDHTETAQAALNLARVYVVLGRYDDAEPLLQQALRFFEQNERPGSNVGVALNALGMVRNARGLYTQAIPMFKRALGIIEKELGAEFPDCADVLWNMALPLRKTGHDRSADEALERARRIRRRGAPAPPAPKRIRRVHLTLQEWSEEDPSGGSRVWRDHQHNVLSLTALDKPPALPKDETALRDWSRNLAESRGAGLIEVRTVAGRIARGVGLIYKCLQLPAYVYTGMLLIPSREAFQVWTIVARERGTTGVREALVTDELMKTGKLTTQDYERSWAQDPYDASYHGVDRSVLRFVSDDECYDSRFPEHPLSMIRRVLTALPTCGAG